MACPPSPVYSSATAVLIVVALTRGNGDRALSGCSCQVVSLRNKDRFKEQEMGVVTLPLQDVVKSDPQYFRCSDTSKVMLACCCLRGRVLAV